MLKLPSPNVATETHTLPFVQRCVRSGCPSWQLVIQAHASWLSKKPSCMKILQVRMRPAAIALNYSIEKIRNDVRQKIITIIIYEKSEFDSLVWSSLMLALITSNLTFGINNKNDISSSVFIMFFRNMQISCF